MPHAEPTDYPAELERIAARAMSLSNPGTVVGAMDGELMREAASLIRRQAEKIARQQPVLIFLEWSGRGMLGRSMCPICVRFRDEGHDPDCPLKAALES